MFRNEPLRDFTEAHHREEIRLALEEIERRRDANDLSACPIVNGQKIGDPQLERWRRPDPSDSSLDIGEVVFASEDTAARAVALAHKNLRGFRASPPADRIAALKRLANSMREEKAYLTALIIREAGKPWREADADVAEAIDFCDYYALEFEKMARERLTEQVLGEDNRYFYEPRGVAVVISPWNFPLAITCGMAVAALVTGNPTILKPAEQTSIIAMRFAELVLSSGFPPSCFAFLPGRGESVGRFLVQHPDVALIAFTGSKAVGLEILRSANTLVPNQRVIKRVIAELGGKNAIVVDDDADMDDAIRGVLYSTFGFSGQKCSACSRLICVGDMYERFVERLGRAAEDIFIGKSSDPATLVGPVIDNESALRITQTVEDGMRELKVLVKHEVPARLRETGYFVAPTVFRDVPRDHPIWTEEIFGPVLACAKADTFEGAVAEAISSPYALTGGVFTRSPANLAYARREFRVGNLYLNRGCTGAMVGRQPFGGFQFSGVGSKAGGPDYLVQFVEPRCATENTMRRGFSPDMG